MEPQPQTFTYLGTRTYVAIIKEIEAMNLKASKGGSVGKVGRRKGEKMVQFYFNFKKYICFESKMSPQLLLSTAQSWHVWL